MFGLLKPQADLLDRAERQRHMSKYCNLCGHLRDQYNLKSRLLVVHDIATLWWLLDRPDSAQRDTHRVANCLPGRSRKPSGDDDSRLFRFLAAISAYTVSIKVQDDLEDGGGKMPRLLAMTYHRTFQQAEKDLADCGFELNQFEEILTEQRRLESDNVSDHTLAAEPTARAYGVVAHEIARHCHSELSPEEARQVGEELGRSVYLTDAVRDFEEDSRGNYNPLRCGLPADQRQLPAERKQQVLSYIGNRLRVGRQRVQEELQRSWHAVERSLLASMGVTDRRSVTLYIGCCIPCGDGAVYADSEECCTPIIISCCACCWCHNNCS